MSRTPARVTQADVARALRAAKQAGAGAVEVRPDGTIVIRVEGHEAALAAPEPATHGPDVDRKRRIVL
ncbi:hypothetical protein [Rhodovulum sp. PH10]|uniref:hypothetical protein n=1 Tax=Rhodovulum sp. PH10 TaxID=1187851 RepID=UPI000590E1BA|nr:hypothetical protein [Rhodovulum sp. PH10]